MKLHSFGNLANNSKDAIDIIYGGDYHYVIIYDRKEKKIKIFCPYFYIILTLTATLSPGAIVIGVS